MRAIYGKGLTRGDLARWCTSQDGPAAPYYLGLCQDGAKSNTSPANLKLSSQTSTGWFQAYGLYVGLNRRGFHGVLGKLLLGRACREIPTRVRAMKKVGLEPRPYAVKKRGVLHIPVYAHSSQLPCAKLCPGNPMPHRGQRLHRMLL
jgi:hypothetical protein